MDDHNDQEIQRICAEAIRANASKRFAVKCLACGKRQVRSLHWLQTNRFKCSNCGGAIDDKPLHEITLAVMRQLPGTASRPRKRVPKAIKPSAIRQAIHSRKHQLVLQFRGDSLADLNAAAALEDDLIGALGDSADVDGHDVGSGETNVFIFTADPAGTFRRAMPVLKRRKCLSAVTAAYCPADGEQFIVLWPEGSQLEFVVA